MTSLTPIPVRDDDLAMWCAKHLGSPPIARLFQRGHLSTVIGLRLEDGRQVVVKIRPESPRLDACLAVQRQLWSRGYPCPQPLAGPVTLAGGLANAESYISGGTQLPPDPDKPRLFAAALAQLVAWAPNPTTLPPLKPTLPWVGWDHEGDALWPPADDRHADLNTQHDLAWLDEVGQRVRARLLRHHLPLVTGHADWESQNLGWHQRRLLVVHDWDSIVAQPEAAIAGAAAAVFTRTDPPLTEPTIEESAAFLASYADSRGRPWTTDECEVCWAAGLWVRTFDTKLIALDEPETESLRTLQTEVEERLRRAGA